MPDKNVRGIDMNCVIACDWLDRYGGAERVIKIMNELFSPTKVYALANVMSEDDLRLMGLDSIIIETTFLRMLGKKFRYGLPLFPAAMRTFDNKIPKGSLILSSSHAAAKAFRSEDCLHICYMQARNMKYIWEEKDIYFSPRNPVIKILLAYLREWDRASAQNPDHLVSNSKFVADWIRKTYNRDSEVIYPPVDVEHFSLVLQKESYYVYVGRLVPYKRVDLIVQAFNELKDRRLLIAGDGTERRRLEAAANKNIEFTGFLKKEAIMNIVSKARGFIIPNVEDFGIAALEAQACGTPVIAYGKGGILETVIDGVTGAFFHEQSKESLKEAIERFEKTQSRFDPHVIRMKAERFSEENFKLAFKRFVDDKVKAWTLRK